jgi:Carboxypeptidase regulatory-like domain
MYCAGRSARPLARWLGIVAAVGLLGLGCAAPLLVGQVTTSSGTPIAGATVTTSAGSGTPDSQGYYRISVPQGTYSVTANASGYSPHTQTGVEVSAVDATPLPIRLAS